MDKLISHARNAKVHAQNIWDRVKPRKRYVGIGVVVLIFIIKSLLPASTSQWSIVNKEIEVISGNIENSIKVIWNTKITDQQTLTFGQEWTIKKIYVKEGQAVKKWDLLAELDKKTLSNSMAQQSLSIQSARLNYEKLFTSTTEADKIKAKNSVDNAQSQLDIAKQQLANMMLSNGDTLQNKANIVQTILLSTQKSISDIKKILEDIDNIFAIKNKDLEDIVNSRLISGKNPSYANLIQSNYLLTTSKLLTLESTYNTINWKLTTTNQEIADLQNKNKDVLSILSTCLNNGRNAIDNTILSDDLTQAKLDWWKSIIVSDDGSVISALSNINSQVQSVKNIPTDIQNKKNEIANDEAQVKMYQDLYQTMVNGPSSADRQ